MTNKNLMRYIPKEYKSLVVDIYEEKERVWNELTNKWNTMVTVEWKNGEIDTYQNKSYMTNVLKEFHGPDEFGG